VSSIKRLDKLCERSIRAYFRSLDDGPDTILSEEDALAAAGQGDQVYLDHTDWPATECADRAMNIAFRVKDELMARYPDLIFNN
jgi:hypothetical protein